MSWDTFCVGVLTHPDLAAPLNDINVDTLWAWSNAETAPYTLMRWNNPMNSTEPWPGARDSGAQPGLHDVKIYATEQDGINATVYTLTREPYYGAICANLRASLPRQQWGATSTAGAELHAWGTGTAWLTTAPYFGPAPVGLGDDMSTITQAEFDALVQNNPALGGAGYAARLIYALGVTFHAGQPNLETSARITDILAAIKAIPAANVTVDNTAVLAAIADLKAHPSVASDPVLLGKVTAIEANLNAPRPPA